MGTEKEKLERLKKRYDKQNEYLKHKYDRVSVVLPKGYKELIQHSGMTVNSFISMAVKKELERAGLLDDTCPFD